MKATYSLALNTLEGKQSFYNELFFFGNTKFIKT